MFLRISPGSCLQCRAVSLQQSARRNPPRGTGIGASLVLGSIQTTQGSSIGTASGTQDLGQDGPLQSCNSPAATKFYGGNFIRGNQRDQEQTENEWMGTKRVGSWLQEICKDGFCTASPSGLERRRRDSAEQLNLVDVPPSSSHDPCKTLVPIAESLERDDSPCVLHPGLANLTNLADSAWGGEGDQGSRPRSPKGEVILQPFMLQPSSALLQQLLSRSKSF